jgi:hypothetical protein
MRIQFSVVGQIEPYPPVYVNLDAVPRLGETVKLPNLPEYETVVRTVVWYPIVDDEEADTAAVPFVYVVLGPSRS